LATYRIRIHGFDDDFVGRKNDPNFRMPDFNILIKSSIITKKLPRRKEEDPSTWDKYFIIDGLKLQVINKDTLLFKHGAMGAY
jgi:hypothetical protein